MGVSLVWYFINLLFVNITFNIICIGHIPRLQNASTQVGMTEENSENRFSMIEFEQLENRCEIAEKEVEKLSREYQNYQIKSKNEIEKYKTDCKIHKESKEKLIMDVIELKRNLDDYEEKLKQKHSRDDNLKYKIDDLQKDIEKLQQENLGLKKTIEKVDNKNLELVRKIKTVHQWLFSKPEKIAELIKSDGLLLSYLDRVYQKDLLSYTKLEKRLQNLVVKDQRIRRSHSFEYLPEDNGQTDYGVKIKVGKHKHAVYNEFNDYGIEDKHNIATQLNKEISDSSSFVSK